MIRFGLLLFCSLVAVGQDYRVAVPPIEDDPKLPRVLLIGDSISIGYGLPVRKLLSGKANVHRIPGNGGPASNGVFMIDGWLGKERWDVIHFNFGLHDLKRLDDGEPQVSIEAYRRYLQLIVQRLKRSGAKLIFATTTPVPQGKLSPPRRSADVVEYNRVALEVMAANGVAVNDLYGFAVKGLTEIQQPVNVHFTNAGSEKLAEVVAGAIMAESGVGNPPDQSGPKKKQ